MTEENIRTQSLNFFNLEDNTMSLGPPETMKLSCVFTFPPHYSPYLFS